MNISARSVRGVAMCAQVQGPIQPAPVVPCDGKALDRCLQDKNELKK